MAKNIKFQFQKATTTHFKAVGVPRTQLEKYDKLKTINPAIDKLRAAFDLDISL